MSLKQGKACLSDDTTAQAFAGAAFTQSNGDTIWELCGFEFSLVLLQHTETKVEIMNDYNILHQAFALHFPSLGGFMICLQYYRPDLR